jgi:signal transduction histidine kinase/two-component SAPR family response regulator
MNQHTRNILLIFFVGFLGFSSATFANDFETRINNFCVYIQDAIISSEEEADSVLEVVGLINKQKRKDESCLGKSYEKLGLYYEQIYRYNLSVFYYTAAIVLYERTNNLERLAYCYNLRGIAHENDLDYLHAYKDYYEALLIYKKLNNKIGTGNAKLNIGLIYYYQRNFDDAKKHFEEALSHFEKANHKRGLAAAYNNLGMYYEQNKQFEQSLAAYNKSLKIDNEINSSELEQSYTINNIGAVYEQMGLYDEAIAYYNRALKMKESSNDFNAIASTLNNLASAYVGKRDFANVEKYLNQAISYNCEFGFLDRMVESYRLLSHTFEQKGNYKEALKAHRMYIELNDSIINRDNDLEIAKIKTGYELNLALSQILTQQDEIKKQQQQKLIILSVSLLLLLLTGYLFYLSKVRKKLNEKIKAKNDEIVAQNLKIKQAMQQAEEAMGVKSRFLSVMSHEIRTPLNAIAAVVYLLNDSTLNDDQKKQIQILKTSTDNLTALVNDVLDLSKIEAGKINIEKQPVNIALMCNNLIDLFTSTAQEKKIQLLATIDERINVTLITDQLRLSQVLINLLSNAIKFTDNGTVQLMVDVLAEDEKTQDLKFTVKDSGIGMDDAIIEKIFNAFEQADYSTTRKYGGTGLGLAICKQILELFNSQISVNSTLGAGSTFSFVLKLYKVSNESSSTHEFESVQEDLRKYQILVVDDDPINIYVVDRLLKNWGFATVHATNGKEAIDCVVANKPDLVLMDLHMDVMNGYDASLQIHKIHPNLPVLAFTASATYDKDAPQKMIDHHIMDKIHKPFQPKILKEKILMYIKQAEA